MNVSDPMNKDVLNMKYPIAATPAAPSQNSTHERTSQSDNATILRRDTERNKTNKQTKTHTHTRQASKQRNPRKKQTGSDKEDGPGLLLEELKRGDMVCLRKKR